VSEVFFPHLQPGMTLLPWVLWATGQLQFPNGPGVLGLAFFFTLDFLAADIFTAALAIGCAALWIFFEAARGERRSRFLALGESVGLGVLAAAPQIVATALWIPETHRAVTGMNLAEATGFSLSPWRLLELAIPFPFGESWRLEASSVWGRAAFAGKPFGFFLTLYSGAFAAVALCSLWKSRDAGARFGRCLFLLAAAASILPGFLPLAWGRVHSPLPLRNPEKFSVALVLGLAIVSARAWDVFRAERRRPKEILAVAVILTVGAVGCALFPGTTGRVSSGALGGIPRPEVPRQLSSALAEAGLLWIITLVGIQILCGRQRGSALAACCLLTAVPLAANRRIAQTSRDEEVFAATPFARRIERADPRREFRTL